MAITQIPVTCPGIDSGIQITKGDTKSIQVSLGIDLTGRTVQLTVKRSSTSVDTLLVKTGTVLSPVSSGNVQFDFVATDTANIPAGFYFFSITSSVANTNVITHVTGQFILQPINQSLIGKIEPILSLGITNSTERVSLEIHDKDGVLANPSELSLQILDFQDSVITSVTFPDPAIMNPQAGIFFYDFTSDRAGDFLVIWTTRFPDEEPIKTIKNIRFVTPAMFRMIPEVLLYIDKSRKATNKPIAFNAVDVAEYIANALRDFNATPPTTTIALEEIHDVYKEVLIQGAIVQALIAQGLLAVDQDFQYNDNGIALTVDHNSKLMGWYQALLQGYVSKKKLYKWNYFQPHLYARTIVGSTFALGFSKLPAGVASRFRGWI